MPSKNNDQEQIKKGTEILGVKEPKEVVDPLLNSIYKEFPGLQPIIEQKNQDKKLLLESLTKESDLLYKMEKQRLELEKVAYESNPDPNAEPPTLNPDVMQRISDIQNQVNNLISGVGEADLEVPDVVTLGEGDNALELTQEQLANFAEDPTELQGIVNQLNEEGREDEANQLSDLVAEQLQQDQIAQPELVEETLPGIGEVQSPERLGQSDPFSNIRENIKQAIGGQTEITPEEEVKKLSSSLKSAVNTNKTFPDNVHLANQKRSRDKGGIYG